MSASATMGEKYLRVDGDSGMVEAIARFVEALARDTELPQGKAYWLRLAAEEITTNIIEHGYRGPGPIWLAAGQTGPDKVWLRIEDTSPAFDPRTHDRHARLAISPEEREIGGFGLLLALHKLDGFDYEYAEGKNHNTLIVRRAMGAPDGSIKSADRG